MFAYKGSTAMITGASKGLGAAFTKELAGRGMNLVLVARSGGPLQELADFFGAQHGVRCVALRADLAAPDAVERIVTELERLDLLDRSADQQCRVASKDPRGNNCSTHAPKRKAATRSRLCG